MNTKITAERIAYLIVLMVGIIASCMALSFPDVKDAHSGAGSFPFFFGAVLICLSLLGLVQSRKSKQSPKPALADLNRVNLILLIGLIAFYLLLMPLLGFISTTALMGTGTLWVLGYRDIIKALTCGFIAAFLLYLVFGILMNVALPQGWIG